MALFAGKESDPSTLAEVIGQGAGAISVCWTDIENAGIFQSELAASFVEEMVSWIAANYISLTKCEPMLGLATTRQMLEEIKIRSEMAEYSPEGGSVEERDLAVSSAMFLELLSESVLNYRTVDGETHTFCGPTDDEAICACGCSGYDERCPLYLKHYHGTTQVPASHICCKIPGRPDVPSGHV